MSRLFRAIRSRSRTFVRTYATQPPPTRPTTPPPPPQCTMICQQWVNENKFILRKLHNRFGGIDKRFVKFETEFNRVDASLDRVLRMTEGFDAPTLQLVHGARILKKWIEIQDKMKPPTFAAGIHQQLWVAQIVTLLNYFVYWVFKNWMWLITTEPQILFGDFCSFVSTLLTLLWKGKTEAAGPVKE